LRLAYLVWRYRFGQAPPPRAEHGSRPLVGANSCAELRAQALDACALLAAEMGEFARAVQLSEEAVAMARSLPPRVLGWCLHRRVIDIERGRLDEATAPLAEAAELFRAER
jgi:hypothetical protein